MTPQECVTELAEAASDLHPLLDRVKLTVTRIGDPILAREVEELIRLNSRTWNAVSELMHFAEDTIRKYEEVMPKGVSFDHIVDHQQKE